MELSYNELKKRDVINLVDGRCLGRITNLKLLFPEGKLVGISVPGKKICKILSFFDKSEIYIPERNIIKIGGDVILVDLSCGEACSKSVSVNKTSAEKCCSEREFPCGFSKSEKSSDIYVTDYVDY